MLKSLIDDEPALTPEAADERELELWCASYATPQAK
jgi:hypothetical protein